jgi:formylmethanofuran dehydrogenase subunit C
MIRLVLKSRPPFRLSLHGVTPERLAGLGEVAVARQPLQQGHLQGSLGDWFAVSASGSDDRVVIAGSVDRLDDVGGGMSRGELLVEGEVGARAGAGMSGGRLVVQGSAGPGAGIAMSGGELRIAGTAGDQLGGALPGERNGMSGGTVIVAGSAGDGAGDRLRRGLIVVAGAVGSCCGARMSAGTIVVGGHLGRFAGAAMRRGSILAVSEHDDLLPSFGESGIHDLVFQRLLARVLVRNQLPELAARLLPLRRWQGDLALGGKGEILTRP